MILLHTADWHLGQLFYDYDRSAEHAVFLDWLGTCIQERKADVLLLSGDVFDSPNPSAAAQKMYYRFLQRITQENPSLQVIIIAGNHDSAARLEAPQPLLEERRITVRGTVRHHADGEIDADYLSLPLPEDGICLAVPFLRQGDYPAAEHYSEGVGQLYGQLIEKAGTHTGPLIVMGHLHAVGAELSEEDRSERTVIGTLDSVPVQTFLQQCTYTALGHLHRSQRLGGSENIRYSGSPLPMSFAEKGNRQGIVCVTTQGNKASCEFLPFPAPAPLLSLPAKPAPVEEVWEALRQLPLKADCPQSDPAFWPYLEIRILLNQPEPSLRHQIETLLEDKAVRLARIALQTPKKDQEAPAFTYHQLQEIQPMEMAKTVFRNKYGGNDMPPLMENLLKELIQELAL